MGVFVRGRRHCTRRISSVIVSAGWRSCAASSSTTPPGRVVFLGHAGVRQPDGAPRRPLPDRPCGHGAVVAAELLRDHERSWRSDRDSGSSPATARGARPMSDFDGKNDGTRRRSPTRLPGATATLTLPRVTPGCPLLRVRRAGGGSFLEYDDSVAERAVSRCARWRWCGWPHSPCWGCCGAWRVSGGVRIWCAAWSRMLCVAFPGIVSILAALLQSLPCLWPGSRPGACRPEGTPLASFARLRVNAELFSSLLHRAWTLAELRLERPVLNVQIDAQGRLNLRRSRRGHRRVRRHRHPPALDRCPRFASASSASMRGSLGYQDRSRARPFAASLMLDPFPAEPFPHHTGVPQRLSLRGRDARRRASQLVGRLQPAAARLGRRVQRQRAQGRDTRGLPARRAAAGTAFGADRCGWLLPAAPGWHGRARCGAAEGDAARAGDRAARRRSRSRSVDPPAGRGPHRSHPVPGRQARACREPAHRGCRRDAVATRPESTSRAC